MSLFSLFLVLQATNQRNLKHLSLLSRTKRLHHFPCKTTLKLQGKKRWVGAQRPQSQSSHCDNTPAEKKTQKKQQNKTKHKVRRLLPKPQPRGISQH